MLTERQERQKEYNKKYRESGKRKLYEKKRRQSENRINYMKTYRQSEKVKKWQREYKKENKEKVNARNRAVTYFPISQECSIEDCNKEGDRHHPDYSNPLDIVWLCREHHSLHHPKYMELNYGT